MLRVVVVVLLVSTSARADVLGSFGAGANVAPTRYLGPGDIDPGEITLTGTSYGLSLPIRMIMTQSLERPWAFGFVVGLTPTTGGVKLGHSSNFAWLAIEALGRVAYRAGDAWNLQVGAGVATATTHGGAQEGILSNRNVDWYERVFGGVAALSLTWLGATRDITFDLRAAYLEGTHLRTTPVILSVSVEWGRERR